MRLTPPMLERIQGSPLYRRAAASPPVLIARKYSSDEAGKLAITIAWAGLLSIFPLVLTLHGLVGLLFDDPRVGAAIEETMVEIFPEQAAAPLQAGLEQAREGAAQRGIIGLVGLVFAGSALFGAMARAFNHVYQAPGRGLIRQRLMAIGMLLLFWVLVLVSLLASGLANLALAAVQGVLPIAVPGWGYLVTSAAWGVALATAFVLFLAIYRVVPNAGQGLREVWPGAFLGAVLFFLLGQAFPLYVRYFAGFAAEYAIFGLFLLIMTWSYFLAQILVLGAEVNTVLYRPWLAKAAPSRPPVEVAQTAGQEPARRAGPVQTQADERVRPDGVVKRVLAAALPWAILALVLMLARKPRNR